MVVGLYYLLHSPRNVSSPSHCPHPHTHTHTVKVCFVLCLIQPILSQSSCDGIPHSVVITTNTTISDVTMSCITPPELVVSELRPETWQWNKLAADVQMFDQQLPLTPDKTTTGDLFTSFFVPCIRPDL